MGGQSSETLTESKAYQVCAYEWAVQRQLISDFTDAGQI